VPPVKKAARPRIDAIVRHIKAGSFDEEMEQIKAAMDERNRARQQAVLIQVKKVFGEKARVETTDPQPGPTPPAARRARPRPGGPPTDAVEAALQSDPDILAAEQAALQRERELEAEMAATANGGDPADEEAGIESNSPIIGSIPD
jgi:hypothetical protein